MSTKLFLKLFCARYTTKLTSNLKRYDSTAGYLQLRLIGHFPSYIKVYSLCVVTYCHCSFGASLCPHAVGVPPPLVLAWHFCLANKQLLWSPQVFYRWYLLNLSGHA